MTLYSHNLNTPQPLPDKIVLSNGFTRTDPDTFTDAEILDAGYVAAPDMPVYNDKTHKCLWVNTEWVVSELSDDEKADIKENAWNDLQHNIMMQRHTALKTYRDTRVDMDANKEPMYLLADVDDWLTKLDLDYIYGTYNETHAQFTIAHFDYENLNPDWTP